MFMLVSWFGLTLRSEERFSRNAETDLVCRLLLEKKKSIDQLVYGRFIGYGNTGKCHHFFVHSGASVSRRNGICAVLFRFTIGNDGYLYVYYSCFSPVKSLYRL